MNDYEIKMPAINKAPDPIQNGRLVYIEKTELHIYLRGKFRKYRWYHRFIKKPVQVGIIKEIDTSAFKVGQELYISRSKPGELTTNPNEQ